jgi:hypothetical protein
MHTLKLMRCRHGESPYLFEVKNTTKSKKQVREGQTVLLSALQLLSSIGEAQRKCIGDKPFKVS